MASIATPLSGCFPEFHLKFSEQDEEDSWKPENKGPWTPPMPYPPKPTHPKSTFLLVCFMTGFTFCPFVGYGYNTKTLFSQCRRTCQVLYGVNTTNNFTLH